MSQQATARAYRPKQFRDFIGQEYITSSLKNSLIHSKIAHGYLFSGSRGVGKTSAARVLAKALNCSNRLSDGEPCLECKSCLEIANGKSIDVIEIDGASHRGIDKMREIKDNLQFLPSYSQYKIYIIDEVHMLTVEAFNAILKTLEEPPSHVVFIFATTEIHKVKNTIRSRCQQYYFKRLTVREISNHLVFILERYNILSEEEALLLISKAADGSMRDAQSILDQAIIFSEGTVTAIKVKEILGISNEDEFLEFLDILISEDVKKMVSFVNELYRKGVDFSFFIVEMINQMRSFILVKHKASEILEYSQSFILQLQKREEYFTNHQCHQIIQILLNLYKDIKESTNEIFYIETTFMQLLEYRSFIHLSELVKRLEALEKGGLLEEKEFLVKSPVINQAEASLYKLEEKERVIPLEMEERLKSDKKKDSDSHHKKEVFNETSYETKPDIVSLLWSFSKSLKDPKWQTIMADIQDVSFYEENKTIQLEFLTQQYKDAFSIQKELQEQIVTYYKENSIFVDNISAYVESAGLISQSEQNSAIKKAFDGKEIELDFH